MYLMFMQENKPKLQNNVLEFMGKHEKSIKRTDNYNQYISFLLQYE